MIRAAILFLALLLTSAAAGAPVDVSTRRINTFSINDIPGARLAFRGGLVLRGPSAFGALSGMLVEGDRLLAITDTGAWIAATLVVEDGELVGLQSSTLTERRGSDGNPISNKGNGDAEALAKASGAVLVYVERSHQLLSYPADGLDVDYAATPQTIPLTREEYRAGSDGMEALVRLGDGRFVLIAEGRHGKSLQTPALFVGGRRFAIRRRDNFAITGADILPGGDIMLVERRYSGGLDVRMRVRRIGVDAIRAGTLADGPVLLEAGLAAEIDNMEAIAAEVVNGEIIVTLGSDDNHNFFQRTLLLRFVVSDPRPRPNPLRIRSALNGFAQDN